MHGGAKGQGSTEVRYTMVGEEAQRKKLEKQKKPKERNTTTTTTNITARNTTNNKPQRLLNPSCGGSNKDKDAATRTAPASPYDWPRRQRRSS